jgi:large subunit ribosomal protein L7/L12
MNDKLQKIIDSVSELTVLELAELVKALEEKFGVSAQAVTVAGSAASAESSNEPKEEQTNFNVILTDAGANKIGVIKAVREVVPTLGLADAKALVESAPKTVLENANKAAAEEAKKKLEAAGAKVELK